MEFAKIIVKDNYEKRYDLVLRSYLRALRKAGKAGNLLLNGNEAIIYGVLDKEGRFHELFTNIIIYLDEHSSLTQSEYESLCSIFIDLSDEEALVLQNIMEEVLFNKKSNLPFEVSTSSDLSEDRKIESDAYDRRLSGINPYQRYLPEADQSYYMSFNNLQYKVRAINMLQSLDMKNGFDPYSQENYESLSKTGGQYVKK